MPARTQNTPAPVPQDSRVEHLDRLARNLDSAFRVPGTRIRFGYDSLLGLIPGVGDVLSLAPSAYILWQAREIGVPTPRLLRMAGNVGLDLLVGAVPIVGDLFDVGFKANRRNVALIRDHVDRVARKNRTQRDEPSRNENGPRFGTAQLARKLAEI